MRRGAVSSSGDVRSDSLTRRVCDVDEGVFAGGFGRPYRTVASGRIRDSSGTRRLLDCADFSRTRRLAKRPHAPLRG